LIEQNLLKKEENQQSFVDFELSKCDRKILKKLFWISDHLGECCCKPLFELNEADARFFDRETVIGDSKNVRFITGNSKSNALVRGEIIPA
jgi:hypothetical protein